MTRASVRAIAAALGGALTATAAFVVAFTQHPDLTFEMDRDLPRAASGFYPVERVGQETFAWTSARAEVALARFDRASAWRCAASIRAGRPPGVPLPTVELEVDGVALVRRTVANDYLELEVTVPARPRTPGLRFAIAASPTFVPPGDPRPLGVQIDRISCRPVGDGMVLPPVRSMIDAAAAAAILGAAFALSGVSVALLAGLTVLVAVAQAFPLSIGPAPYLPYVDSVVTLAAWIAGVTLVIVQLLQWSRREPLHHLARFAIAFSAAALFLKLIGLLHPSKPIVDALFQAHRLEWVLSGRYYFTQTMPDGVRFPYAIALYVFSIPWASLTRDYVTLLRIVVGAVEATAGALLYVMVVRSWNDRVAGALSVVLFHLVPLPYFVLGNGNLTNAFGASASLVTMVAATVWFGVRPGSDQGQTGVRPGSDRGQTPKFAGLTAIATFALLSHVSVFGLLLATLVSTAVFYRWLGGTALAFPARLIFLAGALAAVLAVAIYYGHFTDAYRSLERTSASAAEPPPAGGTAAVAPAPGGTAARSVASRVAAAADQSRFDLGWPVIVLALIGAGRLIFARQRDRLTCAICGWVVTYLAFLTVSVLAPVNVGFERYATEFMNRVDLSTYPAAVLLAACGAGWLWNAGTVLRALAIASLGWAFNVGARPWMGWLGD
jgi:hypothetical protein